MASCVDCGGNVPSLRAGPVRCGECGWKAAHTKREDDLRAEGAAAEKARILGVIACELERIAALVDSPSIEPAYAYDRHALEWVRDLLEAEDGERGEVG